MIAQALEKLSRTDCLLKEAEREGTIQVYHQRVPQASEDIANVMRLLRKAKLKATTANQKGSVAVGARAKASVLAGRKECTDSNLKKDDLQKNKRGKVVTKKAAAAGAKKHAHIALWNQAVRAARVKIGVRGFCPVGGKSPAGKRLYKQAKSELQQLQRHGAPQPAAQRVAQQVR
jgi:hypothetical protein